MLKNVKVKRKILLLTATLLIVLVISGGFGVYFFTESNLEMHEMVDVDFKHVEILDEIQIQATANEVNVLYIIFNAGDEKTIVTYLADIETRSMRINELFSEFKGIGTLDEKEMELLNRIENYQEKYRDIRTAVIELSKEGKKEEAYSLFLNDVEILNTYNDLIIEMSLYNQHEADELEQLNDEQYLESKIVLILIIVFAFIIGTSAAILISRAITTPLNIITQYLKTVAAGDFSIRIPQNYLIPKDELGEIARVTDNMIQEQSGIISTIRKRSDELSNSSEAIASSAQEISASNEEINCSMEEVATNADRQNNSIIETSEVLVQLSSLVQIAQNKALTAKKNSAHTMNVAQQGRIHVHNTIQAIGNINHVSNETEQILNELNSLSKKVSGIIDTINNISSQTNLLALNAAIEAARAGEHGRGFTVVADEVRKLSVQTNIGATEISLLIQDMITQIEQAVKSMNLSKKTVENGVIVANGTDESFVSIICAVEQIIKDIEQISDITQDEVANSDQIVKLINNVAVIAEATTDHTKEVASSIEELSSVTENLAASSEQTSSMANELYSLVDKFKV